MATQDELLTRLDEAETALHKLMTGAQWVRLLYDGKETQFTAANASDLRAYIEELKIQTGQKTHRSPAKRVYF